MVRFDTGERIEIADGETVFVGRDPAVIGEPNVARLVAIDDVDRSISKTHLRLTRSERLIELQDLGSTNGTSIRLGSDSITVSPDEPVQLAEGSMVTFGSRRLVIEAREDDR